MMCDRFLSAVVTQRDSLFKTVSVYKSKRWQCFLSSLDTFWFLAFLAILFSINTCAQVMWANTCTIPQYTRGIQECTRMYVKHGRRLFFSGDTKFLLTNSIALVFHWNLHLGNANLKTFLTMANRSTKCNYGSIWMRDFWMECSRVTPSGLATSAAEYRPRLSRERRKSFFMQDLLLGIFKVLNLSGTTDLLFARREMQ